MSFLPIVMMAALSTTHVPAADEVERVNRLRVQAGLAPLVVDQALTEAARRHAAYLDRHREPGPASGVSAHQQRPGDAGFSGESPAERALAAGYPHREVLENVSMGYQDAGDAIDGLMSAIYHRLTFLDLYADRLGVAVGEKSRVFVLGRNDIATLCAAPPADALFSSPLDCLGQPMRRDYYDALCADPPRQARFRAPHPVSCPNGQRLDAGFMQAVCEAPPAGARFDGDGRYFEPCDNGRQVDADWFLALCAGQRPEALYRASGDFYALCDDAIRVDAEWFEALCHDLPDAARYTGTMRYRRPCRAPVDVRVEYLDALDSARERQLPALIMWPPDGADDVPPAFFIEQPDPLPDREVSGVPVSLQINPERATDVVLRSLTLARVDGDVLVPVGPTRLLDEASDPHQLLGKHEFALFPLQRLDWDTTYRAVAELSFDGQTRRVEWQFRTRAAAAPLLRAARATQQFIIDNATDYWLYLPPDDAHPHTTGSVRAAHLRGNQIELDPVDLNTLRVRVQAYRCDRFRLRFDSGREVTLVPRGCRAESPARG